MTFEALKEQTTRLSREEQLEIRQFLEALLSDQLSEEESAILLRRRDEIKSGKVVPIPASEVEAKLEKKYGLHA